MRLISGSIAFAFRIGCENISFPIEKSLVSYYAMLVLLFKHEQYEHAADGAGFKR